jgi:II/X family phage/plasmid replication protein
LLTSELLATVKPKLDRISRTKAASGTVAWEISTASLETSAQSSISVRIRESPEGPRLAVEASVHKLALGHNILGNADGFQGRVRELLATVSEKLEMSLPPVEQWMVRRVDVALVFDLGGPRQVEQFFRGMRGCIYPRRKVNQYGLESIHAPGSVAAIKLYHKGPEFQKHGREYRKRITPAAAMFLQEQADRRLRVEVELKARRLAMIPAARVAGRQPLVCEVTDEILERMFEAELDVLMRERLSGLAIVRRQEEVHARLRELFKRPKADSLLGFWTLMTTQGEDAIRSKFPKSTFYRQRKQLVGAGVAWQRTDAPDAEGEPSPMEGLTLCRSDPRRCAETIEEARAMVAAADRSEPEGD